MHRRALIGVLAAVAFGGLACAQEPKDSFGSRTAPPRPAITAEPPDRPVAALPTAPEVSSELPRAVVLDGTRAPAPTTAPPEVVALETAPTTTVMPCVELTLAGPLFEPASAELTAESGRALDDLANRILPTTGAVLIAGHTDRRPTTGGNQLLSELRARAVEGALIERGVAAERITSVGHGDTRPVDLGDTDDAHAHNRRVEVTVECA